uniref:Uncharacterized protein n=1 Tax=Utricularia reniformis TaxID=192314 RepID=A0A1Y0B3G6_9LAMI|nr:hypothetical protein AEK19_MT1824 [Utricularia reniformis]ART31995.1 hypothetical protein AEK19_MT1824 [Utricularia reniformis]
MWFVDSRNIIIKESILLFWNSYQRILSERLTYLVRFLKSFRSVTTEIIREEALRNRSINETSFNESVKALSGAGTKQGARL